MVCYRLNAFFESHFSSMEFKQQQENWDGRSNSPVVSADYVMNPPSFFSILLCAIRVEYQHVDRVSLKHPMAKAEGALM